MLKQMPTTIDGLVALFQKMAQSIINKQKAELEKQLKVVSEAQAKANVAEEEIRKAEMFSSNIQSLTEGKVVTE